jgi:ERCC4-type nuclease
MIFIDNRGTGEEELARILQVRFHLAVEVRHLDSGDVNFGDIGIERKSLADLYNSVSGKNRHFWEQLEVLKRTYKSPFVMWEGPVDFSDNWVSGVYFSIILGWRIPVIHTTNIDDSARAVKQLFLKYGRSTDKSYPPAGVTKMESPEKVRWMMLQCVRGIGPKTAESIIRECPFLFSYYNCLELENTLKKVKGLPSKSKVLLLATMAANTVNGRH